MALYSLADFVVELDHQHDYLAKQCEQYRYEGADPVQITVSVSQEQLRRERELFPDSRYPDGYLESVCAYRQLCLQLPVRDAFLMHGCVIDCGGRGVGFLARSGVGKPHMPCFGSVCMQTGCGSSMEISRSSAFLTVFPMLTEHPGQARKICKSMTASG